MQGGVGDFTRELAIAFAQLGHEPHVITLTTDDALAHETAHGVHVHRVIRSWNWFTRHDVLALHRQYRFDVINLQYQAAAYQMHAAINLLPAQLAKHVRTVVTFHDLRVPYLFPKAGALRWRAILHMARGAHHAIVTNVEDYDTLQREKINGVSIVPIGSNITPAELTSFDRAAWLSARHIDPDLSLFGYFGFMNDSKGGDTLLRALAELRARGAHVGLLFIGGRTGASDPTNVAYQAHLTQLMRDLQISDSVYYTDFLDQRGVSAAFAACDCIALPYRDGASFRRGTLMAALAHGSAIVTTHPRVRVPELRDSDNVLLVPPDDAVALADAIQRITGDTTLRQSLQRNSRVTRKRSKLLQLITSN
jgi:glycosyltransferase involved in cell wall biosynthesis